MEPKADISHIHEQIEMIARHEQEFLHRRTGSEKLGDALGAFIGSLWFVGGHAVWFIGWVAWNTVHGLRHFDPRPFPLLNATVALEAIFLASFIVMRQGRISRRSDERDHLILQILILTEREMTAALGVERQMAESMGLTQVTADENLEQLSQETPIEEISQRIQEQMEKSPEL